MAARVALRVVIQDAPDFIPAEVGPELAARAATERDNVRAVKLELGPEGIEHWRSRLGDDLDLFVGSGGLYMLDALDAGATVVLPGCDLTDKLVAVYEAGRQSEHAVAAELFAGLLPLLVWQNQEQQHSNRCVKAVLRLRGLDMPTGLRPPAEQDLSSPAVRRLERYLQTLGLPPVARSPLEEHPNPSLGSPRSN